MLSKWLGSPILFFICQMTFLTTAACLTPTIAYWFTKHQQRLVQVAMESFLFAVLFLSFGFWLFGPSTFGIGAVYVTALILLLEVGSNFIEWQKEMTLNRLSKSISFRSLNNFAETFERMFGHEQALYITVPLALTSGTIIGLFRHQVPQAIVVLCLQLVLLLASFILLYFLIYIFRQMCEPMFKTSQIVSAEITIKKPKGIWSKILEVIVPPPKPRPENQEQQDLDIACDVSELRKVYKYDSLHNTILLVAFVAAALKVTGIAIDGKWVVVSLLATTLFLTEMPYGIGQYLLHQKVLERYTGSKHAEMAKKLIEYAPVLPPWAFLTSLMTTGTAGGFLYFLLDQLIQNNLTNILK